ncbi:MAG: tetratricopeptide repeat protein [Verrucomicrobiales bacterium]
MKSRRWKVSVLIFIGGSLLVAGAGGYKLWHKLSAPEVPQLHLQGVEPAIARAVNDAGARVRANPRAALAWGQLGAVLFTHELYGDAATVFAQAEILDPQQPRWPYLRALSLADLNPDAAVPLLARAAELTGAALHAPRCRLAEFLLERDRLDEAASAFQQVLRHFPNEARAFLGLGRIALSRGDAAGSVEWLERAAAGAPRVRETRVLLATAHQRLGNRAKAEAAAQAAAGLPLTAEWPDLFVSETEQFRVGKEADLKKAQQLLDQNRLPELVTFMQEKVERYPEDPRAWRLLGAAWMRQGKYADAERTLRRAIALPPETADALTQLGMALYQQDASLEAESLFQRALQLQPEDAGAHYGLGLCMMEGQSWQGAMNAFRAAIRAKPDWAQPWLGLGDALTKSGQPALAIEPLAQALKIEPSNADARRLLDRARLDAAGH